jgi:signal peptidase I
MPMIAKLWSGFFFSTFLLAQTGLYISLMNKKLKVFLIVCGFIIAVWVIGRATNAIQFYRVPSEGNFPTINVGERFFATNLIKPKRFDLICFYHTSETEGRHIRFYRLCGIEGDIVQIKDGNLYVNNKMVDDSLHLAHNYLVSKVDYNKLVQDKKENEMDNSYEKNADTVIANFSDKEQ